VKRPALVLPVASACLLLSTVPLASPATADHPPGSVTPFSWSCDGSQPEDGFTDVSPDSVHEAAIDCAVAHGLTAGTSSTTYSPAAPVSRAQMATFLVRLLTVSGSGLPGSPPDAFDDDAGSAHEGAINQLAAAGLVRGTGERSYAPAKPVTRAQMATYLVRAFERSRLRELPQARDAFADDDGTTHERAIDQVAGLQITTGRAAGHYGPADVVRRDQMARFLTATRGCLRDWQRDGSYHSPQCDSYTERDGAQALQDFEIEIAPRAVHHSPGDGVEVDVLACNRRSTPLRQVFPQKDWFTVEARHEQAERGGPEPDLQWYDHRWAGTLNRGGYEPRDVYALARRVGAAHPKLSALTWYDGPQTAPEQVVTWGPGECKALDVGPWQQGDVSVGYSADYTDFPGRWNTAPAAIHRATPGWHSLRLHWGGVEVGQARRYFTVESSRFLLDGPRITATSLRRDYSPDDSVVITVSACNDSDQPYSEFVGRRDTTGAGIVADVDVSGNYDYSNDHVGTVEVPESERELSWAAGECKTWDLEWDQRLGDRSPMPSEQFHVVIEWNLDSESRTQRPRTPYEYLS
jgi:hypothetical protein